MSKNLADLFLGELHSLLAELKLVKFFSPVDVVPWVDADLFKRICHAHSDRRLEVDVCNEGRVVAARARRKKIIG
jgi:hypothetical protein